MGHYVHNIDPVLISIGSLQIRYYGLMYLSGFIFGYFFLKKRYEKGWFPIKPLFVQDLFTYIMVGMMLGARIAYVFIYNWDQYKYNLIEVFYIWQGGLSFHGALVGFIIAMYLFAKKHKIGFWLLADNVAMGTAFGIFLGRIGNFTNGELWGRPSDVPWAMIFPGAGPNPRHPSQLYQSLCEGLLVFLLLLLLDKRERKYHMQIKESKKQFQTTWDRSGIMAACFLLFYGIGRFVVEFFREPDPQLGFYFGFITMGQILCSLMIVPGIYLLLQNIRHPKAASFTVERE